MNQTHLTRRVQTLWCASLLLHCINQTPLKTSIWALCHNVILEKHSSGKSLSWQPYQRHRRKWGADPLSQKLRQFLCVPLELPLHPLPPTPAQPNWLFRRTWYSWRKCTNSDNDSEKPVCKLFEFLKEWYQL